MPIVPPCRWLTSFALAACLLGASACASAPAQPQAPETAARTLPVAGHELSGDERARLERGESVNRPMQFDREGGTYTGGVSYQLVEAAPSDVLGALEDCETLAEMLPRTQRVVPIGPSAPPDRLELTQGNDFVSATYTVALERDREAGTVRFRLDRSRPHDIDDVWGYFNVRSYDKRRSLISVAVALDVGSGLVRMLFERRIQQVILSTPDQMRRVIERDAPARQARRDPAPIARNMY